METRLNGGISILKKNWAVAELKVSYKAKQKTCVKVTCSEDGYQIFRKMWDDSLINIQEQFCALMAGDEETGVSLQIMVKKLDAGDVIGFRIITTGKATSNTVDINFLISCALVCRAQAVLLAHNHPSGNLKPSNADIGLTTVIKNKLEFFEIKVCDHLIVTDSNYFSFADNGVVFTDSPQTN